MDKLTKKLVDTSIAVAAGLVGVACDARESIEFFSGINPTMPYKSYILFIASMAFPASGVITTFYFGRRHPELNG